MSYKPVVRHVEVSICMSLDDEPWQPSYRLIKLAAELAHEIPKTKHPILETRNGGGPRWYERFPGEHYHLLTAISSLLKPGVIWEFGTEKGMSALALHEGNPAGRLYTVDINSWKSYDGTWLTGGDFSTNVNNGYTNQIVSDMKNPGLFQAYRTEFEEAGLIFVDGPKDGTTEPAFLELLDTIKFKNNPLVIFDDIRHMNMCFVWRGIQHCKMDFTSYGHWSGTGLVDWCAEAEDAVQQYAWSSPLTPSFI